MKRKSSATRGHNTDEDDYVNDRHRGRNSTSSNAEVAQTRSNRAQRPQPVHSSLGVTVSVAQQLASLAAPGIVTNVTQPAMSPKKSPSKTPYLTPREPHANSESLHKGKEPMCKQCNCKNSRCLKLYCECFAARVYCNHCNCAGCRNKPEYAAEVLRAVGHALERNPKAFEPKITTNGIASKGIHAKGCNCRKTFCLKKYCECFQAGVICSTLCRCVGCKNQHNNKERERAMEEMLRSESPRESKRRKLSRSNDEIQVASLMASGYFPKRRQTNYARAVDEIINPESICGFCETQLKSLQQPPSLPQVQSSSGNQASTVTFPVTRATGVPTDSKMEAPSNIKYAQVLPLPQQQTQQHGTATVMPLPHQSTEGWTPTTRGRDGMSKNNAGVQGSAVSGISQESEHLLLKELLGFLTGTMQKITQREKQLHLDAHKAEST